MVIGARRYPPTPWRRLRIPQVSSRRRGDGDRRALARLLTLVEAYGETGRVVLSTLFAATGGAWTTGLTGAPGAGKSTLTNELIARFRKEGDPVAVVAVDPSSPFTGGAILGDRVRMQDHIDDSDVYIRSLATRGHLGGISEATPRATAVLDAIGFTEIIIETVGVGQAEVDIAGNADTTVVVVNPGWGDSIQAAKAGLLEIGDVFIVNKADRPDVARTVKDLAADARARRGPGGPPSFRPSPPPVRASKPCGRPLRTTGITSARPAGWPSVAGTGSPTRSAPPSAPSSGAGCDSGSTRRTGCG